MVIQVIIVLWEAHTCTPVSFRMISMGMTPCMIIEYKWSLMMKWVWWSGRACRLSKLLRMKSTNHRFSAQFVGEVNILFWVSHTLPFNCKYPWRCICNPTALHVYYRGTPYTVSVIGLQCIIAMLNLMAFISHGDGTAQLVDTCFPSN